ncbi:uncharacterized protein LOC124163783 [Ischnura elegans]|uniref:uncharacterized protein LOC124163783 n=1 Tax=Ischnura elegans TaxID=197161 RepID=UPI001ED894AA|nr:uncharacterized protein LOC124163783 [Ischnura elegans]
MAVTARSLMLLGVCISAAAASILAPSLDLVNEDMVVEDISEILRSEDRYARCPPQKILIGSRCRQILSEEELRKLGLFEDYSDCVRKNVEDLKEGKPGDIIVRDDLTRIRSHCMTMCMLRAEGL